MNFFGGKVSESTESLIPKEEVIDLTDTQGDMQIKEEEEELEEGELIEEPPKLFDRRRVGSHCRRGRQEGEGGSTEKNRI